MLKCFTFFSCSSTTKQLIKLYFGGSFAKKKKKKTFLHTSELLAKYLKYVPRLFQPTQIL